MHANMRYESCWLRGIIDSAGFIRQGRDVNIDRVQGWESRFTNGIETVVFRDYRDATLELLFKTGDEDLMILKEATQNWQGVLDVETQRKLIRMREIWQEPYQSIPGLMAVTFAEGILSIDVTNSPHKDGSLLEVGVVDALRRLDQHYIENYLAWFESPMNYQAVDGVWQEYPFFKMW